MEKASALCVIKSEIITAPAAVRWRDESAGFLLMENPPNREFVLVFSSECRVEFDVFLDVAVRLNLCYYSLIFIYSPLPPPLYSAQLCCSAKVSSCNYSSEGVIFIIVHHAHYVFDVCSMECQKIMTNVHCHSLKSKMEPC